MKKRILNLVILLMFTLVGSGVWAQSAPPPPPGDGHGTSGDQAPGAGGGAPIGGGIAFLMVMGVAYGGKKYYDYRNSLKENSED